MRKRFKTFCADDYRKFAKRIAAKMPSEVRANRIWQDRVMELRARLDCRLGRDFLRACGMTEGQMDWWGVP